MNSVQNLDLISVHDAMTRVTITVTPNHKLPDVARLFSDNMINSAPVVDEFGKCVGVITSSDLVRYQSELPDVNARIDQGMSYDIEHSGPDGSIELVPHPYDEVRRHMTPFVQSISEEASVSAAARIMCSQHIHHLVVLDGANRPVGVLSSLDILSKLSE